MKTTNLFAIVLAALVAISSAEAVTIDMVTVGNPGNAPDTRYNGISVGSVDHVYQIGKYEVTAGQYTEFLNAVAKADPNALYIPSMGVPGGPSIGTNIQRTGSSPNFSYSVAADWANRPVNYVSFWDAARFANWLHNGQPTGPQGPGTTEGGAYHDVGNQTLFGRNAGARFFIPTENEWYKAAYHKNDGITGNYWDYPTASNTAPINTLPDPGNHANFWNGSYTIGSPYYRTEVGAFANSASPYGTFDQGGNVWEWNETAVISSTRGMRGGALGYDVQYMHASDRFDDDPPHHVADVGFRVASIPEPASPTLGVAGVMALILWRRKK
jgi:formylglycine-generating enzyme required for sulfatase activity